MHPIRQFAAVAVASGVAVASLAAPSVAGAKTAAPTTKSSAAAAAGYLSRQLVGKHHDHLVDIFQKKAFPDDGETADAVLSMDAAGVAQSAATRATKWLEQDAANYAGRMPNIYPGAAAKLLLVAEAQHVNPEAFGSLDLVGAIVGDEGAGGASPGEYQNPGDLSFGSSVLDQALAVLALSNTVHANGPSANAVTFLAGQQCGNAAFQVAIRPNTSVPCAKKDNDVDTTAYAIQALIAAGGHQGAAVKAATWLVHNEHANGGWGETPGSAPDANSTALAIEALVATHHGVTAGERWLAKQQVGCSPIVKRRGAVRFQGTFEKATAIRATSQAAAALALSPLAWIDKDGARSSAPVLACPSHKKK